MAPVGIVHRFRSLTTVEDGQALHQPAQLTGRQQVVVARRPGSLGALGGEERLHEQQATGPHRLEDAGHAGPVEVVEHQHDVEVTPRRPFALEVNLVELDSQRVLVGEVAGRPERLGVAIGRHHLRAIARGRHRMATRATGHIEHPHPRPDEVGMPGKPWIGRGQGG